VIGSEVPTPGGAISHEEGVGVTKVEDVRQTIATVREAFYREGLQSAWEQVLALVVQPGVEFGDDFVLPYQQHAATLELCRFIEDQPLMYEAHSTDYQTLEALKDLTRDHFGILKVGPRLTFVFREAIFSLARMENELFSAEKRSNIVEVLDNAMVRNPEYWKKYYRGTDEEQSFKRKYSLSDRARYYWAQPDVNHAFKVLLENLGDKTLPDALLSEFAGCTGLTAFQVIQSRIHTVLVDYFCAGQQFCGE
jgi:D-tagatose-1,6-bisphosphate aldolase subunit GatZ/KbaZ